MREGEGKEERGGRERGGGEKERGEEGARWIVLSCLFFTYFPR